MASLKASEHAESNPHQAVKTIFRWNESWKVSPMHFDLTFAQYISPRGT
ncbi:hypothetical protein [Rhodopirellula sp. SWK7]|nr:hypothetical protein [Rhodopirellula sp. SWK7]EMI47473.1 hypothetical protein RRSWK_00093 [Rhodopirellula sp. SWK7]